MNHQTDSQLLRAYAEHRSEPAFAELVRRHVDFVYSAARRMVCDSHLAEDVTQGVFLALAKNPGQLTDRPVLSGWLHRTAQNIAAQTVRTDVRRRAREQEAAAMNELLSAGTDASWEQIAPHLDAALGELSEADRDAVLLRYFERKSAREMAQTLGISDKAAQKRVNRAVERVREFFAKRGVTVGASGLVIFLSVNGAQAAPAGLTASLTAAALANTTTGVASPLILTKGILKLMASTKLKTASVVGVALLFGAGALMMTTRGRDESTVAPSARIPATSAVTNLDRTTPKGTLRYLAVMLDSGDARKVADAVQLDAGANPQAESAVVNLVSGQFGFKLAMVEKFGERNVSEALQRWSLLKVPTAGLDEAEERIDGDAAAVQLPGRSPLRFVKVAGNWRLVLTTGNTAKAIAQFDLAGKLMLDAARELDAGKYASSEEVFQVLQSRMMAAR